MGEAKYARGKVDTKGGEKKAVPAAVSKEVIKKS